MAKTRHFIRRFFKPVSKTPNKGKENNSLAEQQDINDLLQGNKQQSGLKSAHGPDEDE